MVQVPASPPKFSYGQYVRPIDKADAGMYRLEDGYKIGLISISRYSEIPEWVYWEDSSHWDGDTMEISHGWVESLLELVEENE